MGGIFAHAGAALTGATATGGHANAITLGTSPVQVIPVNGQRQSLMFMNPSAVTCYVAPMHTATGAPLVISSVALAGCFQMIAGSSLSLSGECQCAWQAFSTSSGSPFTIYESNI
jgi:hypothetical protein